MPQQPAAQLVAVNDGRWDVNTLISPALAAELEAAAAGKGSEEEADLAAIQQLHDALEAMERGQSERRRRRLPLLWVWLMAASRRTSLLPPPLLSGRAAASRLAPRPRSELSCPCALRLRCCAELQGDEAADDDDLRRVAEAIDLYFL